MTHKIFLIFFLIYLTNSLFAQQTAQELRGLNAQDKQIKTVQFHPESQPLALPINSLYASEPLVLSFDILTTDQEQFVYTLELCNYDWSKSELDPMEFIDGYEENTLYPFSASFNTQVDYVHYKLLLPNEDIRFLKSGNYIIRLYNEEQEELLSRRFILFDPATEIDIQLDKFQTDFYGSTQGLSVHIKSDKHATSQLAGKINLSIIQNGNWNTAQIFDDFNVNGEGGISFNQPGQIVFDGINEFRFFDIKSLKFISERVDRMEYKPPHYHIFLKPDKPRGEKDYFSAVDLSGNYFIRNQESNDEHMLDADYAYVHFTFDTEYPLGADVYIEGALSDWQYHENYMQYHPEDGNYQATLLLKQGIYNYRYVTKEYQTGMIYSDLTEGSYHQTGNDYHAFLYYRKMGEFYDRVIGYGMLSTGEEVKDYDPNKELNIIEQLLKEMAR
ncbi:MAG TPA: hypothetical protein DDX98_00365 [Bacteroidales bacterium]|jgi:hypothetical protein|nr:hypothetical protein [Bacteroidales bacterium]